MTTRISARTAMREDVYELFHDYWNLFTALNTYVSVLRHSPNQQRVENEVLEEITKILLTLEERTEAIRARVLALIG